MSLRQAHIVLCRVIEIGKLLVAEGAQLPGWAAQPEKTAFEVFARGYQRTGAQHGIGPQNRPIKNGAPHADKAGIGNFAAVQNCLVANGYPIPESQGTTSRKIITVV